VRLAFAEIAVMSWQELLSDARRWLTDGMYAEARWKAGLCVKKAKAELGRSDPRLIDCYVCLGDCYIGPAVELDLFKNVPSPEGEFTEQKSLWLEAQSKYRWKPASEAEKCYRAALQVVRLHCARACPEQSAPMHGLARTLVLRGEFEDAMSVYKELIGMAPRYFLWVGA